MNQLLTKNFKLHITSTGAGSGIVNSLWKIPGCSSFLAGYSFPYHPIQAAKILGYVPASLVCREVGMDYAIHSFMEAWKCRDNDDQEIIGIGATSSIASIKEHRGDHRVFVSVISNRQIINQHIILHKGTGQDQREQDGKIVDAAIEKALLLGLTLNTDHLTDLYSQNQDYQTEFINGREFLDHLFIRPFFRANGKREASDNLKSELYNFYPGHFNPLHWGHLGVSEAAKELNGRDVIFNTTINPPHKSPLTPQEILQRVAQLEGHDFLLSRDDATYLEKARRYPESSFVLGADTLERILDPKWGHPIQEMMREFKSLNTHLLVSDRKVGEEVLTMDSVLLANEEIRKMSLGDFPVMLRIGKHWDISSTELRGKK